MTPAEALQFLDELRRSEDLRINLRTTQGFVQALKAIEELIKKNEPKKDDS